MVDDTKTPGDTRQPSPFRRLKNWLSAHHVTLMAIKDTPHSIALGAAIGIFFGFTPLWTMKTLLTVAVAWACRSNKVAAFIGVTIHDVLLPVMPAIFWWEYKVGYRVLHQHWPRRISLRHLNMLEYLHPDVFMRWIWPMLVGSLFLAIPSAVAVYLILRTLITRARPVSRSDG